MSSAVSLNMGNKLRQKYNPTRIIVGMAILDSLIVNINDQNKHYN
jgi:hypothetical protein